MSKKKKKVDPIRSAAAKKSAKKRIRIEGRFIPKEVANDLRIFSKRAGKTVKQFIKLNKEDILVYINDKSVTNSYRTDDLISLINNHIGRVETIGYDYKGNKQLFKDLHDFKRSLINRKGVYVADMFFNVKIKLKGKKLIVDLSEMEEIKKTKPSELGEKEFKDITLIISDKKYRKEAKDKLRKPFIPKPKKKKRGKATSKKNKKSFRSK